MFKRTKKITFFCVKTLQQAIWALVCAPQYGELAEPGLMHLT